MKVILASAAVAVLPLLFAGGARAQDAGGQGPAPAGCYVHCEGGGSFSQRVGGGALHAGHHDQAVIVGVTHAFGG